MICTPSGNLRFCGLLPRLSLAALSFLVVQAATQATLITVPVETGDQVILSDGSLRFVGDPSGRVGAGYSATTSSDYVLPFKLPALPAGEHIVSASLSLNLENWYNRYDRLQNVDLYGIATARASAAAVAASDFVDGTDPASNSAAVLLQDNLLTSADAPGVSAFTNVDLKTSGDFGWFVQALYDDGAQPGQYGFLVLSHDGALDLMRYFIITSANSSSLPKPALNLVTESGGRDYYLDTTRANEGSGSRLSPFRTFAFAQTKLQAGDTLYCTGPLGIIRMNSSAGANGEPPYAVGTDGHPISYKAWPGRDQPQVSELIFDGVKRDTYLSFDGFQFSPGSVPEADYIQHNALNLTGAWHISFQHCQIEGASLAIPEGVLPEDPAASFTPYVPSSLALRQTNPAVSSGYPGNASYVTIRDCTISNCGIGIMVYENSAYAAKQSRYWTITNNDISHASEDGIRFAGGDAGAGSVISNNHIHGQDACQASYAWYGYAYRDNTRDATAFNDKQWKQVKQVRSDGTVQTAIVYFVRVADSSDGYLQLFVLPDDRSIPMLRNVSSPLELVDKDTDGSTIQFRPVIQDGKANAGTPANGDSAHTDCISVMGQMTGGFFEKNRAEVSERGGGALKIENIPRTINGAVVNQHPTNLTFQNNLFYSTGNPPVKAALFIVAGGKNCWFIHNTIFGGPSYNPDGAIRFSKDSSVLDNSEFSVNFYNNIIAGGGASNFSATDPLAVSKYNLWMRLPYSKVTSTSRPGIAFDSATDHNLPIGATVPELIEFAAFHDAANGDLHLDPGSMAADIGLPDSGASGLSIPSGHIPATDINDFSRDAHPDAGAYEVGSPADP